MLTILDAPAPPAYLITNNVNKWKKVTVKQIHIGDFLTDGVLDIITLHQQFFVRG